MQMETNVAGELIHAAVETVLTLLTRPGMIGICVEDIEQVVTAGNGRMSYGKGRASGAGMIATAVAAASIGCSPPIEDPSAVTGLVVSIAGPTTLSNQDVDEACALLWEHFNNAAQTVIGLYLDKSLTDTVEISLLVGG